MRTEPSLSRAAERRLRFAAFALLLLLWWGLALVLHSDVLPTPAAVWERLWAHAVSGELWRHLGATLARVAAAEKSKRDSPSWNSSPTLVTITQSRRHRRSKRPSRSSLSP